MLSQQELKNIDRLNYLADSLSEKQTDSAIVLKSFQFPAISGFRIGIPLY